MGSLSVPLTADRGGRFAWGSNVHGQLGLPDCDRALSETAQGCGCKGDDVDALVHVSLGPGSDEGEVWTVAGAGGTGVTVRDGG